jgi:glycerophosphoryl diester phosphodiesterase
MNLFLQPRPAPLVIAHRGASAYAPENTLAAFRLAADQQADAIELDAKLTRDGAIVVMHDPTVDRTTDGQGRVDALTLHEIKQLEAGSKFGTQFAGEPVPLLEEVFEAVSARLLINVELTNYTSRGDGLELRVVDLIRRRNLFERVIVSSFNPLGLRKVKRAEPRVVCGLLYSPDLPIYLRRAWLAFLIPQLDAQHPHYRQVTTRLVRRLHARGQKVNVWTANEAEAIRMSAAAGVDGIMGDDPILIQRLIGGQPQD